ncbi:VOC family protein [uncultured Maribacter sp.]|uniref:VOC family protein n=1 Tax=uncultured Maribacter sp. TaxID=431308 RepID=UPI00263853C5|nr:VOC family protein [uncultured Maribacter sp.]
MKLGAFSISLTVKDLELSKAFYQNIGFSVFAGDLDKKYLIMKSNNSLIGLFQGMFDKNIITFNPGWDENAQKPSSYTDIRDIQNKIKENGISIPNEIHENTSGPASFIITDPDGNPILFDQHI